MNLRIDEALSQEILPEQDTCDFAVTLNFVLRDVVCSICQRQTCLSANVSDDLKRYCIRCTNVAVLEKFNLSELVLENWY